MNLLIIVNNSAAKARRAWPIVEAALKLADIKYDVYLTTAPGDATTKTREGLKAGELQLSQLSAAMVPLAKLRKVFSNCTMMSNCFHRPLTLTRRWQYFLRVLVMTLPVA